jgi:hypothetical protein
MIIKAKLELNDLCLIKIIKLYAYFNVLYFFIVKYVNYIKLHLNLIKEIKKDNRIN